MLSREQRKIAAYRDVCARHQVEFLPFGMETHGALGSGASQVVSLIAAQAFRNMGADPVIFRADFLDALSLTLQKSNAQVLIKAVRRYKTAQAGAARSF